jgi:hypothetical protein
MMMMMMMTTTMTMSWLTDGDPDNCTALTLRPSYRPCPPPPFSHPSPGRAWTCACPARRLRW